MQTLTPEQFKTKYGEIGAQKFTPQPVQSSYASKVGSNLKNTLVQGANELNTQNNNYSKISDQAGGGVVGNILAKGVTAGNAAGTIAKTAGGILGSFIEPILPGDVKKTLGNVSDFIDNNIKSIPGMTPQIHQALGDVFNTVSLLGGEKGATTAGNGILKTTENIKNVTGDVAKYVAEKVPQYGEKASQILASEPSMQVKNILQNTPKSKFDEFINIAQTRSNDLTAPTGFDKVSQSVVDATKQLKSQATSIAKQKNTIIEKARVGLTEFKDAPRQAALKVMQMTDNPLKNSILSELKGIKTKLDANNVIDKIQGMIYDAQGTNVIAKGSAIEKQLRGIVGELNSKLKSTLPPSYANLNAKYANLTNVVSELNNSLGHTIEGVPVHGASLVKQFFSPAGVKARELFDYVKKNTGVDLAQDSTLAKFTGELFNDPNVRSLLQGIPTSRSGVISNVVNLVAEKTGIAKGLQNIIRNKTIQKARGITK